MSNLKSYFIIKNTRTGYYLSETDNGNHMFLRSIEKAKIFEHDNTHIFELFRKDFLVEKVEITILTKEYKNDMLKMLSQASKCSHINEKYNCLVSFINELPKERSEDLLECINQLEELFKFQEF